MEKSDLWDTLREDGIAALRSADETCYVLGDLAIAVQDVWGRQSLMRYASEIGMAHPKRIYEYREVADAITPPLRAQIGGWMKVRYSHVREAVRHAISEAERTGEPIEQSALRQWLESCEDEQMTVTAFRDWLRDGKPEFTNRRAVFEVCEITLSGATATIRIDDPRWLQEAIDNAGYECTLIVKWQQQNLEAK